MHGRVYGMQRLAGTMLDALTARDESETTQVSAKANKIVVACKIRIHCARSRDGTRIRCFQEGKNADVAWGYSPLRHGQGVLQLDEDGVHGQLAVFGAEPQASGTEDRKSQMNQKKDPRRCQKVISRW